jgi:hypothetical protein
MMTHPSHGWDELGLLNYFKIKEPWVAISLKKNSKKKQNKIPLRVLVIAKTLKELGQFW